MHFQTFSSGIYNNDLFPLVIDGSRSILRHRLDNLNEGQS